MAYVVNAPAPVTAKTGTQTPMLLPLLAGVIPATSAGRGRAFSPPSHRRDRRGRAVRATPATPPIDPASIAGRCAPATRTAHNVAATTEVS